jgi:hypothetical protein
MSNFILPLLTPGTLVLGMFLLFLVTRPRR